MIIIGVGCNMSRKKKGKNNAVDEGKALHVTRKNRKRIKNTSSPNDRLVVL